MLAAVRSMIVCTRGVVVSGTETIAEVAVIIVSVSDKVESLTNLIAGGMEILVSPESPITDDPEIIVPAGQFLSDVIRRIGPDNVTLRIGNIDNERVALLGSQGIQYATGPLGNRPQEFIAQGLQLFLCVLVEALQFGRVPFDILL